MQPSDGLILEIGPRLEGHLIEGIGDMRTIMRERFGERVKLRLVGDGRRWWRGRFGFTAGRRAPPDAGDWVAGALATVEERLLWGRFGL